MVNPNELIFSASGQSQLQVVVGTDPHPDRALGFYCPRQPLLGSRQGGQCLVLSSRLPVSLVGNKVLTRGAGPHGDVGLITNLTAGCCL